MEYLDRIQNAKTLNELFEIWKGKETQGDINHAENIFIPDGIVNEECWNDPNKKRILFVLKEAYGDDWGIHTLATWLRDNHPEKRMWKRVAKWAFGIQNTTITTLQPYMDNIGEAHSESLDQIAVMNLKKSGGESTSDYDDIRKYAEYDKHELKKEFELIDPDIIICGSTFKTLGECVFGPNEFVVGDRNENWFYNVEVFGKTRLFIDYYHPANQWPDLMNYYGLISIYQQSLLRKQYVRHR